MNVSVKDGGGSFRDLRVRHLRLFDKSVHRHDRGWPHHEPKPKPPPDSAKPVWKTVGIFHFRHQGDDAG